MLHPQLHVLDQGAPAGGGGVGTIGALFRLNGPVDLVTPSAANTYAGDGIVDGQVLFTDDTDLDSVTLTQRLDGASGSTTVELYRYTGGAWVEIALSGALTLAAGGGANASVTRTFGPITFAAGERLGCMLTAVQARTAPSTSVPTDAMVTVFEAP